MNRVLVTGACGFLGSYVCEYFNDVLRWDVTGIDNMSNIEFSKSGYKSSDARYYNWHFLTKKGVKLHVMDIVSMGRFFTFRDMDFDYIINCAAQPTMTLSIEDPRHDFNVNVVGSLNLLELARKKDVPIALCSSVHVYGNGSNSKLREEETRFEGEKTKETDSILTGDVTPLHASKVSMETYGQCYADTYGVGVGIFRFTGMYGPRQFAGMHHGWVSNFIIRILKGLPVYIFGTDKQVRDILYASDAARVFERFWEDGEGKSGVYNVGAGHYSVSLREAINMISRMAGVEANVVMKPARFGDLYYFVCDIAKANSELGWYPAVNPEEGLTKTVKWVKENIELFEVAE